MPDEPDDVSEDRPPGKAVMCSACGSKMQFVEGKVTHDLYAEKFVCPSCDRVEYRSYGRGSV
jgi:hypothetical protein